MKPLVAHFVNDDSPIVTGEGQLYNYWLAGNGVFVKAGREHMEATVPVSVCTVRGLRPFEPFFRMRLPKVPHGALQMMLEKARVSEIGGQPAECLFHLWWQSPNWHLTVPQQERGPGHVKPLETGDGSSYERALIEVHSHHGLPAFFSSADNADEQGFRLYGVLGTIFTKPTLFLRVGVYGHWLVLPASEVFEMTEDVVDGYYE